ncbi:MAG TPA: NeuD/PglB/VioB family sugar acetyltransferase [Pirellulales bacterium]|nr:NeuD/PglB/VioB family sugar acetyltransferase [Pirellulales bacterium]
MADDNLERVGQLLSGHRIIGRDQIALCHLRDERFAARFEDGLPRPSRNRGDGLGRPASDCAQTTQSIRERASALRAGERELRLIVAVGHNPCRLRIAHELAEAGVQFATAIHPSAVVSPSAEIAPGCFIGPLAMVGCGAHISQHAIINSGAIVEHDCNIEEGASVSPGARLAGRVRIGRGAFVGTGAVVNPRLTIGSQAIVGGGAVVTRSVDPGLLVHGVPAKPVRGVDADRDWQKLL